MQRLRLVAVAAATLAFAIAASGAAAAGPPTGHWAPVGPVVPPLIAPAKLAQVNGVRMGPDGRLYVFGYFFDAGGDPTADNLAVYDPKTGQVSGIGSNGAGNGALNATVADITWVNGTLYVGGGFTNAGGITGVNYLAAWNGTSWTGRGTINGDVRSLASRGGSLYVGGAFTNAGGVATADYVAVFDGAWHGIAADGALNGGLSSTVDVVVPQANGIVYVGGAFQDPGGNTGASYAAWWDPGSQSWEAVDHSTTSSALTGEVMALAVVGKRVILGGAFLNAAGDALADRIVEWTGSAWHHYGSNVAGTDGAVPFLVTDLAVYGSNVLIAGILHGVAGVPGTEGVAAWNGSKWMALSPMPVTATTFGVDVIGRTLYLSGMDHQMGGAVGAVGVGAFGLPAAPSAPRTLAGSAGSKKVALTWKAPLAMNGSALRDYTVQYRMQGAAAWTTFADGMKTTTGATVTGLASGTTYEFRVLAKNDWGTSTATALLTKKAK